LSPGIGLRAIIRVPVGRPFQPFSCRLQILACTGSGVASAQQWRGACERKQTEDNGELPLHKVIPFLVDVTKYPANGARSLQYRSQPGEYSPPYLDGLHVLRTTGSKYLGASCDYSGLISPTFVPSRDCHENRRQINIPTIDPCCEYV
jgi:hypothetical protein